MRNDDCKYKRQIMNDWEFYNNCESDEECKRKVLEEIDNGADVTADDNNAVQWASRNGSYRDCPTPD